jgi:hypothetical protein
MDQLENCIKYYDYRSFHLDAMEGPSIACKNPSITVWNSDSRVISCSPSILTTEKLLWPILKQFRNFSFSFHCRLNV